MRVTQFLSKTLRQDPADTETVSHRLMLKAGMIQQVAAGVYAYLPLALRSLAKIERIIREEVDAASGQEVRMPALQPLETWQETKRDVALGGILFRLKDRRERELVLGPTHEEVVTLMVRANVSSYRDLPLLVYQIQTKFRDEQRPRAGLLRGREFDMMDAYSFDADVEGLDSSYRRMMEAYVSIFRRCELPTLAVEADSGAIGGKDSIEFIMPAESGEDTVLSCPQGHYSANAERAASRQPPAPDGETLAMELVPTPDTTTIAEVAAFLGLPTLQILKAVFYRAEYGPQHAETVLITIRGDLEVNEMKLKNLLKATDLRMATAEESAAAGLTPGYASPVGVENVRVIADESVAQGSNFVAGANQPGHHYRNANYQRDFKADEVADIAMAEAGHGCPVCGTPLESIRGIEVGHVFKLETFYTKTLGANFLDEQGRQQPMMMGCYGVGVTRVLAAAIEQNHDEKGIIFPAPIAPFHVQLVSLNADAPEVAEASQQVYDMLQAAGLDVLWDDRAETAGVKFNDADLLGLPVRVVVSPRNLAKGVFEVKRRRDSEAVQVTESELVGAIEQWLASEKAWVSDLDPGAGAGT